MNILPKKRWHVRTKENIARVRRDEALAAEEVKEIERKKRLADTEARLDHLRVQAANKFKNDTKLVINDSLNKSSEEHVNLFKELETGEYIPCDTNQEHDEEKKEETEKYEKQIGYLTYLGQNTVEATGKMPWYNLNPCRSHSIEEIDTKSKDRLDPVNKYKKYFFPFSAEKSTGKALKIMEIEVKNQKVKKKKGKKHSKSSKRKKSKNSNKCLKKTGSPTTDDSSTSSSVEISDKKQTSKEEKLKILRQQRLQRERQERIRSENLLAKLRGETQNKVNHKESNMCYQKYNSQFNPHIARQNLIQETTVINNFMK